MRRDQKKAHKQRQKDAKAEHLAERAKKPRTAAGAPVPEKKPVSLGIDDDDAKKRRPVWRFAYLDMDGPPSSHSLTVTEFKELHEKLGQYETQTCSEIWDQQANGCKSYDVETAHENITSRLTELHRDDETAVHTLRLAGKFRVYGILRKNVYHLLWIDHEHEMWPSVKKNT